MKQSGKSNSYLKMICWMIGGVVIGAFIGIGSMFFGKRADEMFRYMTEYIREQGIFLLITVAVIMLFLVVCCYKKSEKILHASEKNKDDEAQDEFDKQFDFWGNIGLTGSSVIIYIAMAIFAFQIYDDVKHLKTMLVSCGIFLFVVVGCIFYQIAVVKQIKRKEPLKQGDASDRNFEKVWLNSCDEGERQMIFEAGYKTFQMARLFLLAATLIAILGGEFFHGGLTAVVLLTACNVAMTVTYAYFSAKLGEGKGNR